MRYALRGVRGFISYRIAKPYIAFCTVKHIAKIKKQRIFCRGDDSSPAGGNLPPLQEFRKGIKRVVVFTKRACYYIAIVSMKGEAHMKACIIQPPYSRDVSDSDKFFEYKLDLLNTCDDTVDLIVLPEYSDVPCATAS